MTTQEVAKIIYVIKATYPNSFQKYTSKDLENMIAAWSSVMEDYTYEQASTGLKVYLSSDTKGFPPSPGQVIDCITKIITPPQEDLTVDEAWGYVLKAVSNSGYNAAEEYEKLPDIVKKVVVSPANLRNWGLMNSDEFHTVEKSHFYRSYRTALERKREDAKIPSSVRALIGMALEKPHELTEGDRAYLEDKAYG
ncbi:MAG: hypothetical protein IJ706_08345 [Clostridia bacterium]|nr:hypothetical protein [Clostridia bacterium]